MKHVEDVSIVSLGGVPLVGADSLLLTDLYQLTMLQAYYDQGMNDTAVFEFFVRELPAGRNFLLAAGIEQAVDFLESAHLTADELAWLRDCGRFRRDFVDSLADWRFSGDVQAMCEGTPFFADEPVLRVLAPLREAQLVETRLINLLQLQILVASKAVRCTLAAQGRLLVDFGLRRAHGAEAGLLSARASYLAGFDGTSNVLAGLRWGVPLFGTMAHSYIQCHDDEATAFEHFARAHPEGTTLLIDTYDTEQAAHAVVTLARRLAVDGIAVRAVRIDSGDLAEHARRVRAILDAGGQSAIRIFASGNLDEFRIADLLAGGAPIDGFGVGTRMNTSADRPYLDCAYKLQEYAGQPRRKRSEGKATWPGRKQVFRRHGEDGALCGDVLTLEGREGDRPPGEPLLLPVMRAGRRTELQFPLAALRDATLRRIEQIPAPLRALQPAAPFPVSVAPALRTLAATVDARHASPRR